MPQIKENFFENILFKFESCSCDCVEDIEHVAPGEEPISKFKLQAMPEHPILFGYAAKDGLVRIAPNGTIEERNILGTLMSLANKPTKELVSFMKDNGFLFPVCAGTYEVFDEVSLYGIINRAAARVGEQRGADTAEHAAFFALRRACAPAHGAEAFSDALAGGGLQRGH